MLFPIDPEELPSPPRVNHQAPHELHWRKSPPDWVGSIQAVYNNKYTHLAEQACCLQCGAVPCPVDHEGDERVRVKDMDFVRNVVDTKRGMEEKTKKLHEELIQFKAMAQGWLEQRKAMEYELKQLRILHTRDSEELTTSRNSVRETAKFKAKIYRLHAEFDKMRKERDDLEATVSAQKSEIDRLKANNIKVEIERDTAQKSVRVFKVQIVESKEKVAKLGKSLRACETEKRQVANRVQDLTAQLATLTEAMATKENEHEDLVEEFKVIIRDLQERLTASENHNRKSEADITSYLAEIDYLKAKLSADKRFFQFVAVKREMNVLKDQNLTLQHRINDQESLIPMPVMKKSGEITGDGSRVKSADIRKVFGKSNDSLALVRCSSARTGSALRIV